MSRVTSISQDRLNQFINPDAAMAPYNRAQQKEEQRISGEQKAAEQLTAGNQKLAELIKGDTLRQSAIDANIARAKAQAQAQGLKPGSYSQTINESGFSNNPESDPLGKQIANGLRQANITGYDVADPATVIPSAKDAEEVKKASGQLKALQGAGSNTQQHLKEATGLDLFGSVKIPFTNTNLKTSKGIALDSSLTDMKLQLKELANLGALSGPDMALIESATGNITGVGALVGGKERAAAQLKEVLDRAKGRVESNAVTRGYKPHAGFLDAPAAPAQRVPVKTEVSPSTGKKRITYSDGTQEVQ